MAEHDIDQQIQEEITKLMDVIANLQESRHLVKDAFERLAELRTQVDSINEFETSIQIRVDQIESKVKNEINDNVNRLANIQDALFLKKDQEYQGIISLISAQLVIQQKSIRLLKYAVLGLTALQVISIVIFIVTA